MKKIASKIFIFLIALALIALPAQAVGISKTQEQEQLELELKDIEMQIEQFSKELAKTQTQKATLANKIRQLQIKQKSLTLQIKETALKINELSGQIDVVENNIKANKLKEQEVNQEIAAILRRLNSTEMNLVVAFFDKEGFSGFFEKVQNYIDLSGELKNLQEQNRRIRQRLVDDQEKLEDQKNDSSHLLKLKTIQQQDLVGTLGEQNELLAETKGLEQNYQKILTDQKKRAAELRNRIYELFNTGKQINFGEAVEIAKWASGHTGVRPAYLLAILTQESNLGKNVGTCNRAGDPPEKSWKVIMKPTRDQEPFKKITADLGLDIDVTPVSCPMRDKKGNQIGWGGAMGPAQFIPSTWIGYAEKVRTITGKPADPWDIRDAFLAAAIKAKADGAAAGTEDAEWRAAMKYFAGSVNLKYRFYGDNVAALTKKYLAEIAEL